MIAHIYPKVALLLTGGIPLVLVTACRQPSAEVTQPARIVSGSMAARFWGEHWRATCDDCGFSFRCGVEHPPDDMLAVCPNCGWPNVELNEDFRERGLAVDVVTRDFESEPPRRWEVVAFAEPGEEERTAVKRIVGLPGERVAIRDGEIYVNGELVRKSLAQLRECVQHVYDDSFRRAENEHEECLRPRWQAGGDSAWRRTESGFAFEPEAPVQSAREDLLVFQFGRPRPPNYGGGASPVNDAYGYNQGLNRGLNHVVDLLLTCEVDLQDQGLLIIAMHDGHRVWKCEFHPRENEIRWYQGNEQVAEAPTSTPLVGDGFTLEVAICDRQVLVGINGISELSHRLPDEANSAAPTAEPISISTNDRPVEIHGLRVFRDLYHLNPHYRADDWEMEAALGTDEYFLLGDNSPNSVDSRHYGAVKRSSLVGIAMPGADR